MLYKDRKLTSISEDRLAGPWTMFDDGHSGSGRQMEPYEYIIIQAPWDIAQRVFYAKFDRVPEHVTCPCCGPDYSVDEMEPMTLMEFMNYATRKDALVILAEDITDEERNTRRPRYRVVEEYYYDDDD